MGRAGVWVVLGAGVTAAGQTCDVAMLGSLGMPNAEPARHVVVRDGLAYVANRNEGLLIASVDDPSAPALVSVLEYLDT